MRKEAFGNGRKIGCSQTLTKLKRTEDFAFLKVVDSIALQQSLRDLDRGFVNFCKADTRNPLSLLSRERRLLRSLSDRAFESPSDTSISQSLHLMLCTFKVGDCSFCVQKVGQPFQTLFSKMLYFGVPFQTFLYFQKSLPSADPLFYASFSSSALL